MGTMMNGYHFDLAKENANQYEVIINGLSIIVGATYASALDVYKAITMDDFERCIFTNTVELVKKYDSKGNYVDELIRSNESMNEKLKKQWTRPLPEGMRFAKSDNKDNYFVIGKPQQVIAQFGRFVIGQTGAVLKTNKGYFINRVNNKNIFSKDLSDVVSSLPEDGGIKSYAQVLGIESAKVIRVLIQPVLTDTSCDYRVIEEIEEIKYLQIKQENK